MPRKGRKENKKPACISDPDDASPSSQENPIATDMVRPDVSSVEPTSQEHQESPKEIPKSPEKEVCGKCISYLLQISNITRIYLILIHDTFPNS